MKNTGSKMECGRKAGWERLQADAQRPLGHRVDSCMPLPGRSPDGSVVKNLPAHPGDMGSIPGAGRSHMPRSLLFNTLSSFSFKEQASFTFMSAVTICSDFGAQENKTCVF